MSILLFPSVSVCYAEDAGRENRNPAEAGRKNREQPAGPRYTVPVSRNRMTEKEETKMMNQMMILNMANMMAEDAGLYELRNPEISGLRAKGLFARLLSKKRRH